MGCAMLKIASDYGFKELLENKRCECYTHTSFIMSNK